MNTLTHEAGPGTYGDEPPALCPVLANGLLTEDEPEAVTRLALVNGRVYVFTETDGGSLLGERCLGDLAGLAASDDYDVPAHLRAEFHRWIDGEADAREYGAACRAEALRRY